MTARVFTNQPRLSCKRGPASAFPPAGLSPGRLRGTGPCQAWPSEGLRGGSPELAISGEWVLAERIAWAGGVEEASLAGRPSHRGLKDKNETHTEHRKKVPPGRKTWNGALCPAPTALLSCRVSALPEALTAKSGAVRVPGSPGPPSAWALEEGWGQSRRKGFVLDLGLGI